MEGEECWGKAGKRDEAISYRCRKERGGGAEGVWKVEKD